MYWTGLEGTGVTRDDTITELCRYDQDLTNEINRRSKELNQEEFTRLEGLPVGQKIRLPKLP